MTVLSRDDILNADDLPKEVVHVPSWGGDVTVRALTGDERDAYEMALYEGRKDGKGAVNPRARLVALALVDENGERMFTDADVLRLGRKSGRALDRVFAVAQRLSGIGWGALEAELGNSEKPNGAASSSGSPSS